ncbi:MAG: hypothetical protein Q9169_008053 [Polycauliona sp. 2 TL-2023]
MTIRNSTKDNDVVAGYICGDATEDLAKLHEQQGQICQAELILEEHLSAISHGTAVDISEKVNIELEIARRLCDLYWLFKERLESIQCHPVGVTRYTLTTCVILFRLARVDCNALTTQVIQDLLIDAKENDVVVEESIFINILLHYAAKHNAQNLANYALGHGADIDGTLNSDSYKEWIDPYPDSGTKDPTPLHTAVLFDSIDVVNLLIKKGSDVNCSRASGGEAPLLKAVGGNIATILALLKLLLKFGAGMQHQDFWEWIVLQSAGKANYSPSTHYEFGNLVDILLSHGLDVDARANGNSKSALHEASLKGDTFVVEHLLKKGASVQAESRIGTPLHEAILGGTHHYHREKVSETVDILLRHGANSNRQRQSDGKTPLHLAVIIYPVWLREPDDRIIKALLSHGANVGIQDDESKTPLDYASNIAIRGLLMQYSGHGPTEYSSHLLHFQPL